MTPCMRLWQAATLSTVCKAAEQSPKYVLRQVNGVVRGAALMFQNLHTVVLRRVTHLRDDALAALAGANGQRLKVPCLIDRLAKGVSYCADVQPCGRSGAA